MSTGLTLPPWRALGASRRGAAHIRNGLPNQDALLLPDIGSAPPWILALADGHGSPRSFRSDRGALLAVNTAATVCRHLPCEPQSSRLSAIKQWAEDYLSREIVRCWRTAVDEDVAAHPLVEDAPSGLAGSQSDGPYLAYGATLLIVMVATTFIVYWQLGDGDILTVADDGTVSRPLPTDEKLFGNETTSLCADRAWRDARTAFQVLAGAPPALILAASDGYANSYRDEAGFLRVGSDLLASIRSDGLDAVSTHLVDWLDEISHQGSGDDVTVGVLCRSP
ncbi:MAG: PP2C family serine/threonine-protein phosphatase [Candidatus Competibacteraceae bacterium]